MTRALIRTLNQWLAAESESSAVDRVHLVVGRFTCVEPASLRFAFAAQVRGTHLDGVSLEIREAPLIAFCHGCQQEYRPEIGVRYSCPDCGAPMDDIRSGRELKIERVEYKAHASD